MRRRMRPFGQHAGVWRSTRLPVVVSVAVIMLTGCEHTGTGANHTMPWNVRGPQQQAVAMAPVPVDLEDDGLPAQTPPMTNRRPMPDDPSEPFSPNYGPIPSGNGSGMPIEPVGPPSSGQNASPATLQEARLVLPPQGIMPRSR